MPHCRLPRIHSIAAQQVILLLAQRLGRHCRCSGCCCWRWRWACCEPTGRGSFLQRLLLPPLLPHCPFSPSSPRRMCAQGSARRLPEIWGEGQGSAPEGPAVWVVAARVPAAEAQVHHLRASWGGVAWRVRAEAEGCTNQGWRGMRQRLAGAPKSCGCPPARHAQQQRPRANSHRTRHWTCAAAPLARTTASPCAGCGVRGESRCFATAVTYSTRRVKHSRMCSLWRLHAPNQAW